MTVPSLIIPRSEVAISRLGFGCARIFGGRELKSSARLIEAALTAGIRHFDTAPSYGNGKSEEALGTLLAGVPNVTIATKIGIARPVVATSWTWISYRRFVRPVLSHFPDTKARLMRIMRQGRVDAAPPPPRRKLCRDEVLRELEESLKQLRRSRIDLYFIHEPDLFELTDELKVLFSSLQEEGTIGAFGLAWGRIPDAGRRFGTVSQGRYGADLPTNAGATEASIFHGVLRHAALRGTDRQHSLGPGERIRAVLDRHSDAAIIFSASSPAQISEIASQCWNDGDGNGPSFSHAERSP